MSFPTQYPIFQFFYWLVNTTGFGGLFVGILAGGMLVAYIRTLSWIGEGKKTGENESFTYPSAAIQKNK